jgi:hypothetical protein
MKCKEVRVADFIFHISHVTDYFYIFKIFCLCVNNAFLFLGNPLLVIPSLKNWVLISPNRCKRDAQSFVSTLVRAAQGMRFIIPQPYL